MTTSVPMIGAIRLTKKYGSITALDSLNLKIEGAKCVGLLGPKDAGKTTALKVFTDEIHRSSDRALINGMDAHADRKNALASVAALVETPEIYPALTPREALMMIAKHLGVPHEVVTAWSSSYSATIPEGLAITFNYLVVTVIVELTLLEKKGFN
jgi:ABC-type multidrug transport system ATPase subunit